MADSPSTPRAAATTRDALIPRAKLMAPRMPRRHVARPRLLALLDPPRPLTPVCAPTGFGKSVAVAEWLATVAAPLAWLSLDEADDDDPARFFLHLIATEPCIRPLMPISPDLELEHAWIDLTRGRLDAVVGPGPGEAAAGSLGPLVPLIPAPRTNAAVVRRRRQVRRAPALTASGVVTRLRAPRRSA